MNDEGDKHNWRRLDGNSTNQYTPFDDTDGVSYHESRSVFS